MANALFESGRNAMAAGTASFALGRANTGGTQAVLMNLTSCAGIKPISGTTTGAGAAAVACTAHGFANGDMVCITGVGGTANANNMWVVGGQTTNAFNLLDPITATQGTLVTTYTSGGFAINLGGVTVQTFTNFSAAVQGGSAIAAQNSVYLTGLTEAQGIVDASATTFTAVPSGAAIAGIMLVASVAASGVPVAADIPLAWIDGTFVITATSVATTTTQFVERLPAAFATGTYVFSDGTSVVVTGGNTQFSRSLTTTGTPTTLAGARCTVPATGSGLPVTPNGGNISVTWDTVASPPLSGQHVGIFKL